MPKVIDWAAVSADGLPLARREFVGTGNLPLGLVRSMVVRTTHPAAPIVKAVCDPAQDESIRVFTRRRLPVSMNGNGTANSADTVVIEVANALAPTRFVRVYLRDDGIVVSTEDVNG